jgi:hypothetical protein
VRPKKKRKMRNATSIALLLAVMLLFAGGTAYSQAPKQAVPPAPQAPAAEEPEPPKPASSITVEDGKLSVDLVDADLGNVMNEIGSKMHFEVIIRGSIYGKRISTKFAGLDVERGIERLLSLVQEHNYLIHYDAAGKLSRLELYPPTPVSAIQPAIGNPTPEPYRRRYRRYIPPQPGQAIPGQPARRIIGQ